MRQNFQKVDVRLLQIDSAWKITRELLGSGRFADAFTNQAGAYCFKTEDQQPLVLMDARIVSGEAERQFNLHGRLLSGRVYISRSTNEQAAFKTERDIATGYMNPRDSQVHEAPVWLLKNGAWCLAHIYAGLRIGALSDGDAMDEFSRTFGPSKHQQLHARDWLTRTSAGSAERTPASSKTQSAPSPV